MTTAIEVQVEGLNQVLVRFQRVTFDLPGRVDEVTRVNAVRLVGLVKQYIRSMDLIETGAYLNSWSVLKIGRTSYAVVTDKPQSDRLEYGFRGTDAAGRTYHQEPRAHRRPAAEISKRLYMEDLRKVVPFLWGR